MEPIACADTIVSCSCRRRRSRHWSRGRGSATTTTHRRRRRSSSGGSSSGSGNAATMRSRGSRRVLRLCNNFAQPVHDVGGNGACVIQAGAQNSVGALLVVVVVGGW